jgi:thioredoxin 1
VSEQVRTLTAESWDREVAGAAGPVLVDFWASWCPPCRKLAPAIDALASEVAGRVTVGKLDVDAFPEVAGRYGIVSIPTLLLFKDGHVVARRVGALPMEALRDMLELEEEGAAVR